MNSISYAWWITCFQIVCIVLGLAAVTKPAFKHGVSALFAVLTTTTFLYTGAGPTTVGASCSHRVRAAAANELARSEDQVDVELTPPPASSFPCSSSSLAPFLLSSPPAANLYNAPNGIFSFSHDQRMNIVIPTANNVGSAPYSFYKGLALMFAGLIICDVRASASSHPSGPPRLR